MKKLVTFVLLIPFLAVACGDEELASDNEPFDDDVEVTEPAISVADQEAEEPDEVQVESATVLGDSFVVIHPDDNGQPDPTVVLGIQEIESIEGAGEEAQVEGIIIDETENLVSGNTYWAMLHVDSPNDDEFTFDPIAETPDDPPAVDNNDNIIAESFVWTFVESVE